jgi:hypothetical protein
MYVPKNRWIGLDASTTASMQYNHIEKHHNFQVELVKCITFADLLNKYPDFKCNLLIIDVEGYEYDLISSIQWSNFTPNIVQFENMHIEKEKQRELHALLEKAGCIVST